MHLPAADNFRNPVFQAKLKTKAIGG